MGRRSREAEARENTGLRLSAVMILLCRDANGGLFIPLIERHAYNGAHSAQVSLPGGKFEENDSDLEHTALRECNEEIGISDVSVLGQLTELIIPVSNFRVQPFVGLCEKVNPVMVAQEREVKSLIRLGLDDLLNDALVKEGSVLLPDQTKLKAPYFEIETHRVWGATAMILSELKEIIKPIAY